MRGHLKDDILDDLFHGCAWAAYLDEAQAVQGWPDCETTRRRAFSYYEAELAIKNGHSRQATGGVSPYVRLLPTTAAILPPSNVGPAGHLTRQSLSRSQGTKHMIEVANAHGLQVFVMPKAGS